MENIIKGTFKYMLKYLLSFFDNNTSIYNLSEYITFRAASASITALLICFIIGPWIIKILNKNQIGEEIRRNGPRTHQIKKGTPTMGGIIILSAVLIPTIIFSDLNNSLVRIIIFSTVWMGIIGFIDDYLKIIKKVQLLIAEGTRWLGKFFLV